jgi:hypothetical protein
MAFVDVDEKEGAELYVMGFRASRSQKEIERSQETKHRRERSNEVP